MTMTVPRGTYTPTDTDKLKDAAAEMDGDAATGNVKHLGFDLRAFLQEGMLIDVDARGASSLHHRLDWEEVGVTLPTTAARVALGAPTLKLLPDAYRLPLTRPGDRARRLLERYAFRFTVIDVVLGRPGYCYVPDANWPAFRDAIKEQRAAIKSAIAHVAENYETVRAEMRAFFTVLVADSARRLKSTMPTEEVDEEAVVIRLMDLVPTPARLSSVLSIRVLFGSPQLGSEMWGEARASREEYAGYQIASEGIRAQAERERIETRKAEKLANETVRRSRIRTSAALAAASDEDKLRAEMRALKTAAYEKRLDLELTPVTEALHILHSRLHACVTDILATVEEHGQLYGNSAAAARSLIQTYYDLNWRNEDTALEEMLSRLATLAPTADELRRRKEERDLGALVKGLDAIAEYTSKGAAAYTASITTDRVSALELDF